MRETSILKLRRHASARKQKKKDSQNKNSFENFFCLFHKGNYSTGPYCFIFRNCHDFFISFILVIEFRSWTTVTANAPLCRPVGLSLEATLAQQRLLSERPLIATKPFPDLQIPPNNGHAGRHANLVAKNNSAAKGCAFV